MGLFDAFTGDAHEEAAAATRDFLDKTKRENFGILDTAYGQSSGQLTKGYGDARAALDFGYMIPGRDIVHGTNDALSFIEQGRSRGQNYLGGSQAALTQNLSTFDPVAALGNKYGGATSLALNALGVNGADAARAAQANFTTSPAYEFNLNQGLEAINRRRNAAGMLASGNADRDAQNYGAGLASNEYDKWLTNLQSYVNPEMSATNAAATGRSGALNALAGLGVTQAGIDATAGNNSANLVNSRTGMLASLGQTYGQNTAGTYTGEGTGLAGLTTNTANQKVGTNNQLAPAYANTYKMEADANAAGSANTIGAIMNVGKMAAGFF